MKTKIPYWELLRDPRWQRKRLEVYEAADFSCEWCGESEKTLNAHHTYYLKNRSPWDYPTEHLRCLCEDCHELATQGQEQLKLTLGELDPWETTELISFASGLLARKNGSGAFRIDNEEQASGVGAAFLVQGYDVLLARDEHNQISVKTLRELFQETWKYVRPLEATKDGR
jgi:hypothetical protein